MFVENTGKGDNSRRSNDDLNERDDDLMYSHTFTKSKINPDNTVSSNPYQNKSGMYNKNFKESQESLFERDSMAASKFTGETDLNGQSFNNASTIKTRTGDANAINI